MLKLYACGFSHGDTRVLRITYIWFRVTDGRRGRVGKALPNLCAILSKEGNKEVQENVVEFTAR